jgi:RNA polymerase sigma factor (sigma-70 family)
VKQKLTDADIIKLWNQVYNISRAMLHDGTEAEDATQEIFLRIVGSLSSFRNESTIETWVYRIARNYLLDSSRRGFADTISFETFAEDVGDFRSYVGELGLTREEEAIYADEVKVGCTLAMLQCLDADDRFVFILGNIFGFEGALAAAICEISETNYRRKLSRARKKLVNFMRGNCGLMNENAFCRCRKRLTIAFDRGRIDPERLLYRTENARIRDYLGEMNEIDEISRIFRDNPLIDKSELFDPRFRERFAILGDGASIS